MYKKILIGPFLYWFIYQYSFRYSLIMLCIDTVLIMIYLSNTNNANANTNTNTDNTNTNNAYNVISINNMNETKQNGTIICTNFLMNIKIIDKNTYDANQCISITIKDINPNDKSSSSFPIQTG